MSGSVRGAGWRVRRIPADGALPRLCGRNIRGVPAWNLRRTASRTVLRLRAWCVAAGISCWRAQWNRGRILQAGEYRFDRSASPLEVFDRIARGDVFYYALVVPEGQNMFDIAQSAGALGLFSANAVSCRRAQPGDDPRSRS